MKGRRRNKVCKGVPTNIRSLWILIQVRHNFLRVAKCCRKISLCRRLTKVDANRGVGAQIWLFLLSSRSSLSTTQLISFTPHTCRSLKLVKILLLLWKVCWLLSLVDDRTGHDKMRSLPGIHDIFIIYIPKCYMNSPIEALAGRWSWIYLSRAFACFWRICHTQIPEL